MNVLKGYLTYLMAAIAVLGGIVSLIQGYTDQQTAVAMIWGGLTTFGVRRALG